VYYFGLQLYHEIKSLTQTPSHLNYCISCRINDGDYELVLEQHQGFSEDPTTVAEDLTCGRTNLNYTDSSTRVLTEGLPRTSNGIKPLVCRVTSRETTELRIQYGTSHEGESRDTMPKYLTPQAVTLQQCTKHH
jgi:hypothetical protein